jgi:hypothetical protein
MHSNEADENEERSYKSYNNSNGVSPNVSDHVSDDDLYGTHDEHDHEHDEYNDAHDDLSEIIGTGTVHTSNTTVADMLASGTSLRRNTQRRGATATTVVTDENSNAVNNSTTANNGDATDMFESDEQQQQQQSLDHDSEVAAAQLQQQFDTEAATAGSSTTDTAPDAYKVSDAGYTHVNGVYKRMLKPNGRPAISDGLPIYCKKASSATDRKGRVHHTLFVLYRCVLDNDTRRWFISVIEEG